MKKYRILKTQDKYKVQYEYTCYWYEDQGIAFLVILLILLPLIWIFDRSVFKPKIEWRTMYIFDDKQNAIEAVNSQIKKDKTVAEPDEIIEI